MSSKLTPVLEAYERFLREDRPEDAWAYDAVGDLVRGDDGEQAWEVVVAIVRRAPKERLEYVGAGPLEDFVVRHGRQYGDWLVGEARRDPRFRTALASIWLRADALPPEVLAAVQAVTGRQVLVFPTESDAAPVRGAGSGAPEA